MKKYLCTLTISISLFLIAGPVSVQAWGIPGYGTYRGIQGYVTECVSCGTGDTLGGVVVGIVPEAFAGITTSTGDDGQYGFLPLNKGCYTATFSKPGYTTVTKTNQCVTESRPWVFLDVCLD